MRASIALVIALCACDDPEASGFQLERVNMISDSPILDMDVAADGTIYILTQRSVGPTEMGVSHDRGRTWALRTTNGVQVSDLEVIGTSMLVVSDHGLVRYSNITEDVWGAEVYPSTFGQDRYDLHDGMSLFEGTGGRVFALRHWFGPAQIYQSDQLYHSTDEGVTWTNIPNPHLLDRIGIGHDGHIYGGNPSKEIYRSTDLGASWTLLGTLSAKASRLFATTTGSVYVFTDNGACHNAPDGTTFVSVPFCPQFEADGELYAYRQALVTGDVSTIWRSHDGFVTHDEIRMPFDTAPDGNDVANGGHIFVGGRSASYFAQGGDEVHPLNLDPSSGPLFIEASGHYWSVTGSNVIVRDPTTEGWTHVIDPPSPPVAEFDDGVLVFEGFTSPDRGVTLTPMGAPPFSSGEHDTLRFATAPDDTLHFSAAHYALISGTALWTHNERATSSDRGATWTLQPHGVLVTYVHPQRGDVFGYEGDPALRKLVRSTDGGVTWTSSPRIMIDYDCDSRTELWHVSTGATNTWWLVGDGGERRPGFVLLDFESLTSMQIDRDRLVVHINSSDAHYARTVDPY